MPDPLPDDFAAALQATAARRGVFGQPLTFLSSTSSTNDVALGLAEQGAAEGTTVLALTQTSGRGRHGRPWFSPPGAGLYFSIVLRTGVVAPLLTLAGGVAVAEGIREATGLPVSIKWPNDVVVPDRAAAGRRRKLAGILAEGSLAGRGLQHVVLGIGINVTAAAYPADLAARVTSIEAELGRTVEAPLVFAEILAALHAHVTALRSGEAGATLARWRALAPTASGSRVRWNTPHGPSVGTTTGIADDGALLVRADGGTQRIISGEVEWL